MRTTTLPRPPVIMQHALEDSDVLLGILERQSPHPLTLAGEEFVESRAALRAGAKTGDVPPFVDVVNGEPRVPPVFRTTWGAEHQAVEGADVIVNNPRFIEAARQLYDAEVVRPYFTRAPRGRRPPPPHRHSRLPGGGPRPVPHLAAQLHDALGVFRPLAGANSHRGVLVLRGRRRRVHLLARGLGWRHGHG